MSAGIVANFRSMRVAGAIRIAIAPMLCGFSAQRGRPKASLDELLERTAFARSPLKH